nr:uncharacterized protein LOC108064631 isoform X2 [Drosophila takahashii]
MLNLNLLVILGLCCLINTLPVQKSVPIVLSENQRNQTLVDPSAALDRKLVAEFGLFGKLMPMVATKLPDKIDTTKIASTRPHGKWNRLTTSLADPPVHESDLYNLAKKLVVKSKPKSGLGLRLFGNPGSISTSRVLGTVSPTLKDFPRLPAKRKFPNFWKKSEEKEATEVDESLKGKESEGTEAAAADQRKGKRPRYRGKGLRKKTGDGKFEGYEVTELTVQVPNMQTDRHGNWVYNPWGVTYGRPFMDPRFTKGWDAEKHGRVRYRVEEESGLAHAYLPHRAPMSTVCLGRSTIYNYPKVFFWLNRMIHNVSFDHRTIWMDLRRELYVYGRSEECHTVNYTDWREFQECSLRRNQRMEYMIPQYPLHQIGYRKYYHKKQAAGGQIEDDEDEFGDDF